MKQHQLLWLSVVILSALLTSCKKDDLSQLPTSFPRKQLVELFTSQDCMYCPNGIQQIGEAIKGKESRYVRLYYAYGDNSDDFTIYPNKQLAAELGVTNLPSMLYNRNTWTWDEQIGVTAEGKVFHPYYFSQLVSEPAATTTVSVNIKTTYDASTRQSDITISGKNIGDKRDLTLFVMLKESGLHAAQEDAYNTWDGWSDYVHNNVVRAYLNTNKGQVLEFDSLDYKVNIDYELYHSYEADNCMVVAFLIDNATGEVVNAEETPLVSGTKGGADFVSEGITAVPVSDNFPETMALPSSKTDVQYLTAQYYTADYTLNGHTVVEIMMLSSDLMYIQNRIYLPMAILYVVTDGDGSTLPTGTFNFSTSGDINTAVAGQKIEEEFTYYGSEFFIAKNEELNKGYIVGYEWLLTSGTLTITENSITYEATTLSGNHVRGSFSGTVTHFTSEEMPQRRPAIPAP